MTEWVEIDGPNVRARLSEHECGRPMICFQPFRPASPATSSAILGILDKARSQFASVDIIRICLDADQSALQSILQSLGFSCDGVSYQFHPDTVKAALPAHRLELPKDFSVRQMDFDQDIEAIVSLEKTIHAADTSSRVDFDSDEAVASMRKYYRHRCDDRGAFVLTNAGHAIAGIIGFMPDQSHQDSIHVSSVGLARAMQGSGLFFAFLFEALAQSKFHRATSLTGTTTTTRLIEAAQRYRVGTIGSSWSNLVSRPREQVKI